MSEDQKEKKDPIVKFASQLSSAYNQAKAIATEKTMKASAAVNREIRISSLKNERKKMLYELGKETYSRIKGETCNPFAVRLEDIDRELEKLSKKEN